jgi:aspartyl-tRNA(Asn)/glutamyl-tRNA(Gln) amidotransferase subunit B
VAWEPVIGLEVHAQLLTKSKMFCGCSAAYADDAPNSHVCPICAGMPGVLPVINREAVRFTIMTGLALHCTIPEYSKFDRKNYFYPDLPKGYQISQYDLPLARHGYLDVENEAAAAHGQRPAPRGYPPGGPSDEAAAARGQRPDYPGGPPDEDGRKRIGITRVHLEEDTGKSTHPGGGFSLVDFNRCGIPLMEIVSEPDMRSPEEARQYFMQLRSILLYLGVSDGDMSKGNLRCDANVSVRPVGSTTFGTKTEIKNMNSFRAVKQAIEFEIARQIHVLEMGGVIVQETRGWVEETRETVSQRSKEFAEDYRYFPEPDLPPLDVSSAWVAEIATGLPEMADARAARFERDFGLSHADAAQLTVSRAMADLFEQTAARLPNDKRVAANWLLNEFKRLLGEHNLDVDEQHTVRPEGLARLIQMVERQDVSTSAAKRVFEEYFRTGDDPAAIVRRLGLQQVSDRATLEPVVRAAIAGNGQAVADYKRGKKNALQRVVGVVMRELRGANARAVEDLLHEIIDQES